MSPLHDHPVSHAARRRTAGLLLATVTALAVLASMVQLADAFLDQAEPQQQAAEPAAQSVRVSAQPDGRG